MGNGYGDAKLIRAIRAELKTTPNDPHSDHHWLYSELGVCYYESRKYKQALKYDLKALALAPRCPMVLWNYAGTLDMLGRTDEAIAIYKGLLKRGVQKLAYDECGEDAEFVTILLNDCRYRLAGCYKDKGDFKTANKWLKLYLARRTRKSIYTKAEALKMLRGIT